MSIMLVLGTQIAMNTPMCAEYVGGIWPIAHLPHKIGHIPSPFGIMCFLFAPALSYCPAANDQPAIMPWRRWRKLNANCRANVACGHQARTMHNIYSADAEGTENPRSCNIWGKTTNHGKPCINTPLSHIRFATKAVEYHAVLECIMLFVILSRAFAKRR